MENEIASLLKPAGVSLAWRSLTENRGAEVFERVFLVKFKGVCNPALSSMPAGFAFDPFAPPVRLAATQVVDGEVLPRAEVECDAVRQGIVRVPPKRRRLAFAEALGQVVAHELFHSLAQTLEHGRQGLAKSVLCWDELGRAFAAFHRDDIRKMERTGESAPSGPRVRTTDGRPPETGGRPSR